VLQCVDSSWRFVLKCVAVCFTVSTIRGVVYCSVLQCVAVCCGALQCVAVRCSVSTVRGVLTTVESMWCGTSCATTLGALLMNGLCVCIHVCVCVYIYIYCIFMIYRTG